MRPLRVGAATTVINPAAGSRLQGHITRDGPATAVLDDLSCRAIALEGDGGRALIVACDLLEFHQRFVAGLKRRLQQRFELSPDRCLICATHTHTAPPCIALGTLDADELYLGRLEGWIVAASEGALAGLEEATVRFAALPARSIGINRRLPGTHGVRMAPNPAGPMDPEAAVLAFVRPDGTPLAALVHHSVHPTTLGVGLHVVSADYPGRARRYLERRVGDGLTALFAQGACGDVRPAVVGAPGSFREGTEGDIIELGRRLGEVFVEAWRRAVPVCVSSLSSARRSLELPFGTLPTPAELEQERRLNLRLAEQAGGRAPEAAAAPEALEAPAAQARAVQAGARGHLGGGKGAVAAADSWEARHMDQRGVHLAVAAWAGQMLALARAGSLHRSARGEIQAISFGRDLALVGFPGELFSEIGMRIKKDSPFRHTVVCGYAGGTMGYVPTRAALAEGGYEVEEAYKLYRQPAAFRDDVEQIVCREVGSLLADLYEAS